MDLTSSALEVRLFRILNTSVDVEHGANGRVAARMSIGAIAKRTGLRVSAIRYYESAGLIPPTRRVGGKRVYDASVFEAIALIQLAQDAGFTLAETRILIAGFERGTPAATRWQTMARRKLVDIEERLDRAQRMKAVLERLLRCKCETLGQCVKARTEALVAVGAFHL